MDKASCTEPVRCPPPAPRRGRICGGSAPRRRGPRNWRATCRPVRDPPGLAAPGLLPGLLRLAAPFHRLALPARDFSRNCAGLGSSSSSSTAGLGLGLRIGLTLAMGSGGASGATCCGGGAVSVTAGDGLTFSGGFASSCARISLRLLIHGRIAERNEAHLHRVERRRRFKIGFGGEQERGMRGQDQR